MGVELLFVLGSDITLLLLFHLTKRWKVQNPLASRPWKEIATEGVELSLSHTF